MQYPRSHHAPKPSAALNAAPVDGILTAQNVFDDSLLVGVSFVSLAIGAAQRPEVIQHDINCNVRGRLTRASGGVRLRMTNAPQFNASSI